MTTTNQKKTFWALIWLLSVTVGPLVAASLKHSLSWAGLLIACAIANLIASWCLMTTGPRIDQTSRDSREIAEGCLLSLGGAVLLAAFYFMGCTAWQF